MSIKIVLTEKEILERSNDSQLGEFVRCKYLKEKSEIKTSEYNGEYDICIVCGKESPYRQSTHIDLRNNRLNRLPGNLCKTLHATTSSRQSVI